MDEKGHKVTHMEDLGHIGGDEGSLTIISKPQTSLTATMLPNYNEKPLSYLFLFLFHHWCTANLFPLKTTLDTI